MRNKELSFTLLSFASFMFSLLFIANVFAEINTNSNILFACDLLNPSLDCDSDGLINGDEQLLGTNPSVADSDGDGVTDGQEITDGTTPTNGCSFNASSISLVTSLSWNSGDCDGDGVSNRVEVLDATDLFNTCDFDPEHAYLPKQSGWFDADCDSDGLSNSNELLNETEAGVLDSDGDGVKDGIEINDKTNPKDICSYIHTSVTEPYGEEWYSKDCDGDGVVNKTELDDNTNPTDKCEYNEGNITLDIINYCRPYIPEGFSPNGDNVNDVLEIIALEDYPNHSLNVYNRWGNIVYKAAPYKNDWNGNNSPEGPATGKEELPAGIYFYTLDPGNGTDIIKGSIYINR
jgi:gliding motility-associated-like protein